MCAFYFRVCAGSVGSHRWTAEAGKEKKEKKVAAGSAAGEKWKTGTRVNGTADVRKRTDGPLALKHIHFPKKKETYLKSACRKYAGKIKTHQEMHIGVNKLPQRRRGEKKALLKPLAALQLH